jgi:hypothetical protein
MNKNYLEGGNKMKAYFLTTANGPLVILTSYNSIENLAFLKKLDSKGISKFIAHEVSVEIAKARYGMHFDIVLQDLHENDDMRILDYNGEHAFKNFSFKELGPPVFVESGQVVSRTYEAPAAV